MGSPTRDCQRLNPFRPPPAERLPPIDPNEPIAIFACDHHREAVTWGGPESEEETKACPFCGCPGTPAGRFANSRDFLRTSAPELFRPFGPLV